MVDNSRVGVTFARKRTVGGRRGGSFNNGGDRYPRGGDSDSRYRRRYSPRQDDRYKFSLCKKRFFLSSLFAFSTPIDVDDILVRVHVVQFNRTNAIIGKDQDHDPHRQSKNWLFFEIVNQTIAFLEHVVIDNRQEIVHLNNKQLMLFAGKSSSTMKNFSMIICSSRYSDNGDRSE